MSWDAAILDEKWQHATTLTQASITAYQKATSDTNAAAVPACFAFVAAFPAMRRCVIEFAGRSPVIHRAQRIVLGRPLQIGDHLETSMRVRGWTGAARGTLLELEGVLRVDGDVAAALSTVLYVMGASPSEPAGIVEMPPRAMPAGETVATDSIKVGAKMPQRYAESSGDDNPIHLDPAAAGEAGWPSVVLHGMCSLAMAVASGVRLLHDGDHTRVTTISVTFGKPVLPGRTIEFSYTASPDGVAFGAATSDGPVLRHGLMGS